MDILAVGEERVTAPLDILAGRRGGGLQLHWISWLKGRRVTAPLDILALTGRRVTAPLDILAEGEEDYSSSGYPG